MITYQNGGDFTAQVGLYATPIKAHMMEYGTQMGDSAIINELCTVRSTTNAQEAIIGTSAHGYLKKFKGTRNYSEIYDLYKKILVPEEINSTEQFSRKLLDDNKFFEIDNRATALLAALKRTKEALLANYFVYADTNAGFTLNGEVYDWTKTGDGVALVNDSHTTITGKCTTTDNKTTADFDGGTLETAINTMAEFTDEMELPCNYSADQLLVGGRLRKKAMELIESDKKPATTNNDYNVYNGWLDVMVWDKFTKQSGKTLYPWYVMDSVARKDNLYWLNRIDSEISDEVDFDTMSWKLGVYARVVCGSWDYRWVVGNIPA